MAATGSYRLTDRYTRDAGTVHLSGIQALARLPIEQLRADAAAGHRTAAFISGYPGSPVGGFDTTVAAAARSAPDLDIKLQPALNEEYAATAIMGTQLVANRPDATVDGVLGLWYGKAPGLDRAADAMRHAVYAGTSRLGGAVALVGDDPAAKSSTLPSSSASLLADLHLPLFYPGDPAEALHLGRHAIALSRASGLWTALKIVADVADGTSSVELGRADFRPVLPTLDGRSWDQLPDGKLLTPRTLEIEQDIIEIRYELARRYASDNKLNSTEVDPSDAWIGIVASGITFREVREALSRLGLSTNAELHSAGIRLLKMSMPMPFDPNTMRRFARGLEEIVVVEEKQPNLEQLITAALYSLPERPRIVGKNSPDGTRLLPAHGALVAHDLLVPLRSRLAPRLSARLTDIAPERERVLIPVRAGVIAVPSPPAAESSASRSPFFCSGCPHNRSTEVPDGALVGAGIGCHTMTLLMDPDRVGEIAAITCMGNEGTQWIGMSPFVETEHLIQNLGDGTYFHSGQLAITAAIAAGVDITYKVLFNGAVAMTGGQLPQGQLGLASVARILLEQGASEVLVTTDDVTRTRAERLPPEVKVWDRARLIEAQTTLSQVPGVTVLLHDQACTAELRRARSRGLIATPDEKVVINNRVCEGCGDCGQVSNCLSIQPSETPYGRKTRVDQTTCNLDASCLEGDCPSFMTVTAAGAASPPGSGLSRLPHALADRFIRHFRPTDTPSTDPASSIPEVTPGAAGPGRTFDEPTPLVSTEEFAVRMTGIGGTGVVTISQLLGTAAMLDGYTVKGLDQTGLSQKAGPVVSDLRLSRTGPIATNRIGPGRADLLLALDQLVASSDKGRSVCSPERTVVVGSTSGTPTGQMVTHPEIELPDIEDMADNIAAVTRPDVQIWADAARTCELLFGDARSANVFVVGMAAQAGALPIGPERIREALQLNGVAVETNLAAFTWGRCAIADPMLLASTIGGPATGATDLHGEIDRPHLDPRLVARIDRLGLDGLANPHGPDDADQQLRRLARDLVGYQDVALAARWLDLVESTRAAEVALADSLAPAAQLAETPSPSKPSGAPLTMAVAINYHRLLAAKDEYEVARLLLDPDGLAEARRVAGAGGTITWHLHPPMLAALGLDSKVRLGPWAEPMLRRLAAAKRLRGTRLDLFGRPEVRRAERSLPNEYTTTIETLIRDLDHHRFATAIAIAELPDLVRGYESLKLRRVAEYRATTARAIAKYQRDN